MGSLTPYHVVLMVNAAQETAIRDLFCRENWVCFMKALCEEEVDGLVQTASSEVLSFLQLTRDVRSHLPLYLPADLNCTGTDCSLMAEKSDGLTNSLEGASALHEDQVDMIYGQPVENSLSNQIDTNVATDQQWSDQHVRESDSMNSETIEDLSEYGLYDHDDASAIRMERNFDDIVEEAVGYREVKMENGANTNGNIDGMQTGSNTASVAESDVAVSNPEDMETSSGNNPDIDISEKRRVENTDILHEISTNADDKRILLGYGDGTVRNVWVLTEAVPHVEQGEIVNGMASDSAEQSRHELSVINCEPNMEGIKNDDNEATNVSNVEMKLAPNFDTFCTQYINVTNIYFKTVHDANEEVKLPEEPTQLHPEPIPGQSEYTTQLPQCTLEQSKFTLDQQESINGHLEPTLEQAESEVEQPESEMEQPESEVEQPKSEVEQPESELEQPEFPLGQPVSALGQPKYTQQQLTSTQDQPESTQEQLDSTPEKLKHSPKQQRKNGRNKNQKTVTHNISKSRPVRERPLKPQKQKQAKLDTDPKNGNCNSELQIISDKEIKEECKECDDSKEYEKGNLPDSNDWRNSRYTFGNKNLTDSDYKCAVCNGMYVSERLLRRHVFKRHRDVAPKFCCDVCYNQYNTRDELRAHRRESGHKASQSETFQCELCGQCMKRKETLRNHMKCVHSDEYRYSCEICGMMFKTVIRVQAHKKSRHVVEPTTCDICGKMFPRKRLMTDHRKRHVMPRDFKCDECGKAFLNNQLLKQHLRVHTGERPFKCSLCKYACAIKQNLVKHMRIHNKPKT